MSRFDAERRAAAVVLPIFAAPPHGVLFVQRAAHLRHHPGQIALPGGGLDPEDEGDLERAALRELTKKSVSKHRASRFSVACRRSRRASTYST